MLGALCQGLINYGQNWLLVFPNKVLLEHIHIDYFLYCLSAFIL